MFIFLLGVLLFLVGLIDLIKRKIPNELVWIVFLFSFWISDKSILNLYSFMIVAMSSVFLFYRQVIAAGDSKLATALAVAIPVSSLPFALWLTAMVGGGLALVYWMKYRLLKQWPKGTDPGLPYGVAIGVGFYLPLVSHYL